MTQLAEVERAARLMGYRKVNPTKPTWSKPFGYTALVVQLLDDGKWVIDQWFIGADQKLHLWSSKELHFDAEEEHGTLVSQIKFFEAWNVKRISCGMNSTFEFLSPVERAELLIDGNSKGLGSQLPEEFVPYSNYACREVRAVAEKEES